MKNKYKKYISKIRYEKYGMKNTLCKIWYEKYGMRNTI